MARSKFLRLLWTATELKDFRWLNGDIRLFIQKMAFTNTTVTSPTSPHRHRNAYYSLLNVTKDLQSNTTNLSQQVKFSDVSNKTQAETSVSPLSSVSVKEDWRRGGSPLRSKQTYLRVFRDFGEILQKSWTIKEYKHGMQQWHSELTWLLSGSGPFT